MSLSEIQSSVMHAGLDLGIVLLHSNQLQSQLLSNQGQNVFEMDQTLRGFNWGEIFNFIYISIPAQEYALFCRSSE